MTAILTPATPLTWHGQNATVTLSVAEIAGRTIYRVETLNGSGAVINAWTKSYDAEHLAREAASRAAHAFKTHGTEAGIERHAHLLRFRMRDLLNGRRTTRAQIEALEAEIAAVTNLDETAELAALTALAA